MVFCHSFVLITFEFYSLKECIFVLFSFPFVLCFSLLSEFCILVYGVAILFFSFSILSFLTF